MTRTALLLGLLLGDGLSDEEFARLHAGLQPPQEEVWQSIPWKTSLLEARAQAIKEKKPLFMWAMDGTPLGCG